MQKVKLLRITTVPISLVTLLKGQPEFFSRHNFDVLTVSSSGEEIRQLKSWGVAHQVVNMTRRITPLRDWIALVHLIILIQKYKPTIVHTHTPKAGLLGMVAAWLCRVPVRMHTIAGLVWLETTGIKRQLLILMERLTYACAVRVYPNSIKLTEYLRGQLRFEAPKMRVIGRGSSNGIDNGYFHKTAEWIRAGIELRKQHHIEEREFVFCFIGRMVRDKGLVELVEAFGQVSTEKKTRLILVGHQEPDLDPLPAYIIKIIRQSSNIIEAGYQEDVRPWLSASHAFVLPSYREGFPNVVMQAACMELPCIVSDINGCNEMVLYGKTGLIVPPKNIQALSQAMKTLIDHHERSNEMGKAARQFVSANFEQQAIWNELLKEYQTLLTLN